MFVGSNIDKYDVLGFAANGRINGPPVFRIFAPLDLKVLTAETNTPIDITQTVSVVKPRKGPDKGRYVLEPSLIIKIGSKNDATVNYIKDKLSINTITQLIKKQVNKERFSVGPQEIVYRFYIF